MMLVFHSRSQMFRRFRPLSLVLALSVGGAGCALFDTGGWNGANNGDDRQLLLKPLPEDAPEALRLEYFILERPASDPLIGDELWDELLETGLFDQKVRDALNSQGMRVGVTSSSPPQALQKLIGEAEEITDESIPQRSRAKHGQMLVVPSGAKSEAQTSDVVPECELKIEIDGELKTKTFTTARGVVRVEADTIQDGWATFEFLPEIHYGAHRHRPQPGNSGWKQYETSQNVQKLYGQRFKLTLVEGDAAIVTSLDGHDDRVGPFFFESEADGVPVRRMLVVRLHRTGEKVIRR